MSMGYGANHVQTIEDTLVRKIVPDAMKKLDEALRVCVEALTVGDIELLARETWWSWAPGESCDELVTEDGELTPEWEEVHVAYQSVVKGFEAVTGLELVLGFHDSNNEGSAYDDVNGAFWCLGGVFEYTPAAKKFLEKHPNGIQGSLYVTFG